MAPFLYYSLILTEYILLLNMFAAIVVQNMAIVKAGLSVYVFASLLKARAFAWSFTRLLPLQTYNMLTISYNWLNSAGKGHGRSLCRDAAEGPRQVQKSPAKKEQGQGRIQRRKG